MRWWIIVLSIVIAAVVIVGFVMWLVNSRRGPEEPGQLSQPYGQNQPMAPAGQPPAGQKTQTAAENWQEGGFAITGTFADADAVDLGGGKYRLYYTVQPEVKDNQFEMYSATSTDGKTWTQEPGTRKTFATFPDVVKLADGTYRLYFQSAGVIKSATSSDGLTWKDDPGIRIDSANSLGLTFDNVAAPTTFRQDDGTFLMVYRGTVNEKYSTEMVPNPNTQIFLWASSKDGLTWEKQGLAIDSRNSTLKGLADGPDWVRWDDGTLRLYFWSYSGVYYATYKEGKFSDPKLAYAAPNDNPLNQFPQNPPGDPTLIKVGRTWFMYYGQHGEEKSGIAYATLRALSE